MGDFALHWDLDAGNADIALVDDDVAADDGLRTAIMLSLFTDRRAEIDDELPTDDDDRRGWWADEFAEDEGDRIGSRLWLLARSKRTAGAARRAEELARDALAWLLDDRVADAIDVAVETDGPRILILITVHRPAEGSVAFRFAHVWSGEAAAEV